MKLNWTLFRKFLLLFRVASLPNKAINTSLNSEDGYHFQNASNANVSMNKTNKEIEQGEKLKEKEEKERQLKEINNKLMQDNKKMQDELKIMK